MNLLHQDCPISGARSGRTVTLYAKVVAVSKPATDMIAQCGVLADSTGAMQYIEYAGNDGNTVLDLGSWYRIRDALIRKVNGIPMISIQPFTRISYIEMGAPTLDPPKPEPLYGSHNTGVIPAIRVKVIREMEAKSDRIFQTGTVADAGKGMRFIVWKDASHHAQERLVLGKTYTIYYPYISIWEGRESLTFMPGSWLEDDVNLEIPESVMQIATAGFQEAVTITGILTDIREGSGPIYRCPVAKCKLAVKRTRDGWECTRHGLLKTEPRPDLRIKASLDDGYVVHNALLMKEATEAFTGLTLAEALNLAKDDPLGPAGVRYHYEEQLCGRYAKCTGIKLDDNFLVKSAELVSFDPTVNDKILMDILALRRQAEESAEPAVPAEDDEGFMPPEEEMPEYDEEVFAGMDDLAADANGRY